MAARIDSLVTAGSFSLDGGTWDLENNVWIVGDETECIVIDAAHDPEAILAAVGSRTLLGIYCTHAHNDHIGAVADVQSLTQAPAYLHPADDMLWKTVYPNAAHLPLENGQHISVAGTELAVIHTPGHSPGAVCFYAAELGTLFSGDTLFHGGPGATGRSYSDFPTIIESIATRLLTLPAETIVLTGHGESTTIGDEAPELDAWVARGY
ncbi:MBL fold metallo-hydrolase [Cryobacterium psychrophilum]|uniref:MBL fold metallo-hydrolase n=1 Tax=Cryobacterium psychrophilum TaxID=41988 RepID=A0A4Y8KQ69_9MICO|nr:MBL fold metallo-hydrolase [Cryobacterium psychrophilum]TDW29330.1 glyoxylase-like metal-dependent hydrolase (beta-lactamase superfamily II) [Cryobacterium psychrophilum]TFD80004.1 MBL fold metallo-hydrolase [Cryobacterium psychrophilum]